MTSHLLAFSISPVQDFIEQARKTQDLYAGSMILSHLCRIAAQKAQDNGGTILFPADINRQSIPNRFVARFDNDLDFRQIGESLANSVYEEFGFMATGVLASLGIAEPAGFNSHVSDFFSVSWVFRPFNKEVNKEVDEYLTTYRETERLLGAVKGIRQFRQIDGERGRKCGLCGERDVKFYRKTDVDEAKEARTKHRWTVAENKLSGAAALITGSIDYKIPLKYLQHGEGLCGVCFTKRSAERYAPLNLQADFPSVATIALLDVFAAYEDKTGRKLPQLGDEQLIFELYDNTRHSASREEENRAAIEFVKALKDKKIAISHYYAVLVFDADNLGKVLSGDSLYRRDGVQLEVFQKALSKRFGAYGDWARSYLNDSRGRTVYAGGDDFLGFVNLSHLLPVMNTLREQFDEIVNKPLAGFLWPGTKLTFSAGIAIAHFKIPLREVLGWARRMEQQAKGHDRQKNAFAMVVLKHSGEIHETCFPWQLSGITVRPAQVLQTLIESLRAGRVSSTFVKSLWQEFPRLMNIEGKCDLSRDIIATELLRLLHKSESKEGSGHPLAVEPLTELLTDLMKRGTLRNFLSFLSIADFISRKRGGL